MHRYLTHVQRRAAIRLARHRTARPDAAVAVEVELPLGAGGRSPVVAGEVTPAVSRLTLAEWLARPTVATPTLF